MDTVIVKLFSEFEKTQELYSLLSESQHQVLLDEVEDALVRGGQYNALFMLYRQRGDTEKLLDGLAKYVTIIRLSAVFTDIVSVGSLMATGQMRISTSQLLR